MQKYEFSVTGMSCGHCKKRVEDASLEVAGVTSAEVDLAAASLTLMAETALDVDLIISAIDEAGFEASLKQ